MTEFWKDLLGPLASPLTWIFVLCLLAAFHRRRRLLWLWMAIAVLCLFGWPRQPWNLRGPLVRSQAPLTEPDPAITNIVMLAAGGFATDASVPVNGRATEAYLYRFLEGVRVHRALPGSRLLVSVSRPDDVVEARRLLDELAALVGVEAVDLVPVVGAENTRDEARLMAPHVSTNAFYLVTSDLHMTRALMIFKNAGLHPLPAPAGSCGRGDGERPLRASVIYPNAANLQAADQAIHEYLGLVWERVRR